MARGRDKHQAHQAALAGLGRILSRRARNACELCEDKTSLKVIEVAGSPEDEPGEEWAVMACARCEGVMSGGKADTDTLRFLEASMWSELRPVQLAAVRILKQLDAAWAADALEGLYLDPEVEALL